MKKTEETDSQWVWSGNERRKREEYEGVVWINFTL